MKNFACNSFNLSNDLIVNIDLCDINSYNPVNNNIFKVNSLVYWNGTKIGNLNLPDAGLTLYDYGILNNMNSGITITTNDNKFSMQRIGENNASGNTSGNTIYANYALSSITSNTICNYILSNGGYLTGYYKLFDYDYEILPYRYNYGFTINTWLRFNSNTYSSIQDDNDGIFLYLGSMAENKYFKEYTGGTGYTFYTSTGETTGMTSLGNKFTSDNELNPEDGIIRNNIAFRITKDRYIEIKYIDENNVIKKLITKKQISVTTNIWKNITIVFKPYEIIYDEDLLHCYKDRDGDLSIYVNGVIFEEFKFFKEIWFKELNTDKEKQIGVPYRINWGGGSFGLKHSFRFNNDITSDPLTNPYTNVDFTKNLLIENNFDGSFYGGLGILQIYNKTLNFNEVKYIFEEYNSRYSVLENNVGGRLIYYS